MDKKNAREQKQNGWERFVGPEIREKIISPDNSGVSSHRQWQRLEQGITQDIQNIANIMKGILLENIISPSIKKCLYDTPWLGTSITNFQRSLFSDNLF